MVKTVEKIATEPIEVDLKVQHYNGKINQEYQLKKN